jgi:hypothetical protein
VEIERKGKKLRIVAVSPPSKLENLERHPGTIIGDPEDLVHMDWSAEWKPSSNWILTSQCGFMKKNWNY